MTRRWAVLQSEHGHVPSFELALQRADRDTQRLRRMRPIATVLLERLLDGRTLEIFERRANRNVDSLAVAFLDAIRKSRRDSS